MTRRFVKILEMMAQGTGGKWACRCCIGLPKRFMKAKGKRAARHALKREIWKENTE